MRNRIKKYFSKHSIFFLFSANVFFVILLVLTIIASIGYVGFRLGFFTYTSGILTDNILENPFPTIFIILILISIVIGVSVIMGANAVILKPIREMSANMKKLADGNFDARISLEGKYFPKEITDFSKDFNTAAQELSGVEVLRKDFINDFSHEFKTPIVSIGGFARHILDENLSKEEMTEYLQIIASESDRLAALATNVLNLTKVEAQTINIGKVTFNASEQIRRTVLMLESKLDEKELDLDLDIGEVECYGNTELLNQVWVNLLDNAIKFSTKGMALNVKLFDFYDTVVFKVKDNGIGMDEATQARVFDKFYQSDTSRTTQGNGLGMTLVKKIVSLHDGQIEVESRLNEGTTITVVLPKNM